MKIVLLLFTHLIFAGIGFAAGVYMLPILIASTPPDATAVATAMSQSQYQGEFQRQIAGSDALHWGEGKLLITDTLVVHDGTLAPGPDYRLYLSPTLVRDEAEFAQHAATMVEIGHVTGFNGFALNLPPEIDVSQYGAAVIWCKAFGEFITAASLTRK